MADEKLLAFETQEGRPYSRVDVKDGKLFVEGHPYPLKCIPYVDAIRAVNWCKRNLLTPGKGLIRLEKYLLYSKNLCVFAQGMRQILLRFSGRRVRYANLLAQILHYDEAYRFRLQDLFAETTAERLSLWPCAEILRLLKINKQRDHKFAHRKFALAAYALVLFFLWPPNRKRLREALKMIDYAKLLPDEGDMYWMSKKIDYKYANTKTA